MAYVVTAGDGRVQTDTVTPIRIATGRAEKAVKVGLDPIAITIAR
jgi:hypothetical protein